nr:hypothetical protein [Nanoarchaeum sp.]
MVDIELTDFIGNIYERFGLIRKDGIVESIWGSERTRVNIPVYERNRHIDNMPLTAYMVLAELDYLGGRARVPDMFNDCGLSGSMNGHIAGILACLARRNFIETNASISARVLSEMGNGIKHIETPDGCTHLLTKGGIVRHISTGGPPTGMFANLYMLKDLSPYHICVD